MQLYTQLKLVKRITKTNNSKSTNDHNAGIKGRWAAGESRRTCQLLVGAVVVVSFKILYNIYRQTNVFTMFVFVFVDISSILFRASWQSICIITINITFIITMPLFNGSLNLYSYCVRIGLWATKAGLCPQKIRTRTFMCRHAFAWSISSYSIGSHLRQL